MVGSVAIVGSSSILTGSSSGVDIDAHDHVIRFNRAPTIEHEQDVGAKTTFRIVNPHVFQSMPFDAGKGGGTHHPGWIEDDNFVKDLRDTSIGIVRGQSITNPTKHVHKSVKIYRIYESITFLFPVVATVGLVGLLMITKSEIIPTVYGWTISDNEPMSHYYNNRSPKSSNCHNWVNELRIVNKLASDGKIIMK